MVYHKFSRYVNDYWKTSSFGHCTLNSVQEVSLGETPSISVFRSSHISVLAIWILPHLTLYQSTVWSVKPKESHPSLKPRTVGERWTVRIRSKTPLHIYHCQPTLPSTSVVYLEFKEHRSGNVDFPTTSEPMQYTLSVWVRTHQRASHMTETGYI